MQKCHWRRHHNGDNYESSLGRTILTWKIIFFQNYIIEVRFNNNNTPTQKSSNVFINLIVLFEDFRLFKPIIIEKIQSIIQIIDILYLLLRNSGK